MNATKQSQKAAVLQHLIEVGSLSAVEALNLYGVYRLAARIHELVSDGWHIGRELHPRPGKGKSYARYIWS